MVEWNSEMNLLKCHTKLQRIIHWIDRCELGLTFVLMVLIILINALEIFSRYALDSSFFWVHEITILMANWMYFIGACLVYHRRRDIEIESFTKLFSKLLNKVLSVIVNCAIFVFLLILAHHTYNLVIVQSRYTTHGLGIPNHIFTLPLLIGTISIMLIVLNRILGIYLDLENP